MNSQDEYLIKEIKKLIIKYKYIELCPQINNSWDESQHPREKNGRFRSKAQKAIFDMLEKQKGKIKSAFYRKDIGHIDLLWGDGKKGLSHIVKRRQKDENFDIYDFLSDLDTVVQKGKNLGLNDKGRYEIKLNEKVAIIEPIFTNGKQTFLLTAYKQSNKK